MSEERTEPAVPSFKARLAMFNQPQAESTGSPPPKPTSKPREWKRPTPPTETPSETPHSQTDPQGGPARDFSATDAKASISAGGGSLKERMARLQGLQPVAPVAPGTGGSQNLRPWEQAKSPSSEDTPTEGALENQEASVSEEMTLKVEANQDAPAPPSPNADQPSPTAEQGIKVGAGGPSAPLAVPRRAGPPRRNRPQAQKSTSSTSIPSAAGYPSPSQDARPLVVQQDVPAAREDDSQPEEHEKAPPEQISPLEGETATASASIKHDMFDERKDDAFDRRGKKELPVFGLESGQQSNEESEKAIGAKSENVEPNDQHENNEESDEARRARVMQKMATMGGQRLGMFPMAVPPAASSNEEGVQEIQSDVATTTPVASSGPSAEPPRARSSEEEELRASDLPEQTLQTDSDVEKPPSSPSRTAPLSRQESTSVSESAHIESASLSKAAAAVDEEEKASPFKPPVDSLKPELPSLPPQFAKDSKASDEESERDEAWDDEKPPCVPIRAPPCPPTRPAPSDTADEASSEKYAPREQELPTSSGADDAVQSGESEVQASSPPPLPAGRPTVSAEPQSSKPMEEASLQYSVAIEEASEDHDDPLTETTVPTPPTRDIPPPPPVRASDSQNQTSTPLSLETKTPSRQSSIASPTSLSRRSSRPAIPPPFSPAAAEDPVQSDSNSVKSPRMSVDNGRIAANSITESPPNSPQPGRTSSLGGESRPQSMSQPPDPPRRVSVQSTAPESHSEPGKPDLTEEGKDAEPSEVSEEQEEADRRARLAERMRKLGGQKFGMFPMMGGTQKSRQSSLQEDADAKSPTSPSAPGETPDEGPLQEKTKPAGMPRGGVAIPGLVPRPAPEAQTSQQNEEECSPSPAKQPTPSVDDEQSVSETEHEEEPQSPAVPPPLPPARPGLSLDTKSTRDVSVKEKADEVASPSVPPRPSGGHSTQASQSATSPQSEERHPFIDFGDGKKSLELQDPRTSPTVSQMPTSASSAGGFVDKVGSPAHLDQYTQSELLQFSKSYGSQVFAAAKTKSKDGTKWSGESASFNFVSAILAEVPGLEPPSGKSDFGQLIYRINSPNGTMPADDLIRLGDIVVVKQAKMRAKLGSTSIGMGSTPFVAVISDPYDAKKHKVHFLEVTKSGKVEAGGFHLDHLKEGSIELYRAVPPKQPST